MSGAIEYLSVDVTKQLDILVDDSINSYLFWYHSLEISTLACLQSSFYIFQPDPDLILYP